MTPFSMRTRFKPPIWMAMDATKSWPASAASLTVFTFTIGTARTGAAKSWTKAAFPGRKVVAVVGDGCFLMSGMELASAKQEGLPIVVVLINDSCLTLIKATQERRYAGRTIAVDLHNPDFGRFAEAFGVRYWQCEGQTDFERCFRAALECDDVALVELRV